MSCSEADFKRLEQTGAMDYADKRPAVYPAWIYDCRVCSVDHPIGMWCPGTEE